VGLASSRAALARAAGPLVNAVRTFHHSANHDCREHSPPAKIGKTSCRSSSLRPSTSVVPPVKILCLARCLFPELSDFAAESGGNRAEYVEYSTHAGKLVPRAHQAASC
jgi:hypothetical protein